MAGASFKPRFPALDLKNGKIYWTAGDLSSNAGVFRADVDGSNPEQIVSTDGIPQGIALDPAGGKVYWLLYH